jgi:hypothetical protein
LLTTGSLQISNENSSLSYHITIQRNKIDIGTVYWRGTFGETRSLARIIAWKSEAESFHIVELGAGEEIWSEQHPFGLDGP